MEERFDYVDINDEQERDIDLIRDSVKSLAFGIKTLCPDGRGKSLAMTKLEECIYWANKSICGNDN